MTVTIDDVVNILNVDEPNYLKASELGPDALPHLTKLIHGTDTMLASKAAYLVSLIKSDRSGSILEEAAKNKEPLVRIAVASGIHNLPENHANKISDLLINDSDAGIRKVTIKSISKSKSPILLKKIQNIAEKDQDQFIRELASKIVKEQN